MSAGKPGAAITIWKLHNLWQLHKMLWMHCWVVALRRELLFSLGCCSLQILQMTLLHPEKH